MMVGATVATVMVTLRPRVPLPPALVAVIVAAKLPVTKGVPEIKPVAVATLRPVGNPVAPKLVGELVAVI